MHAVTWSASCGSACSTQLGDHSGYRDSFTEDTYSRMQDLRDLARKGEKLRANLTELAEWLNKHHRNVKLAKLAGSASAIVGGVVTVFAAVAAAATGGLTLPLAGAGMMLSGAGGAVTAGASLAQMIIEACNVADLQKEWDEFIKAVIQAYKKLDEASKIYSAIITGSNASLFVTGFNLTKSSLNQLEGVGLKEAVKRLSTGATQIGKAAKDGGLKQLAELGGSAIGNELFFLNVALIPINFIDLVKTAVELSKGEKSAACLALLKMADMARGIVDDLIKKDEWFSCLSENYKALLQ